MKIKNREHSSEIDLGISILRVLILPHQILSHEDIAAWCDCSPQAIQGIESRALLKIREKIKPEKEQLFDCIKKADKQPSEDIYMTKYNEYEGNVGENAGFADVNRACDAFFRRRGMKVFNFRDQIEASLVNGKKKKEKEDAKCAQS